MRYPLSRYFCIELVKKIRQKLFFFKKERDHIFPFHFTANWVTNPNDDCSQLSFEIYYLSVARNWNILELGPKRYKLSYSDLSYLFGEHKDTVVQGTAV